MNNAGFFNWLRDSVRRSVLLGFSDAVEQLGTPSETNDLNPQLLAVLRQAAPAVESQQPVSSRPAARSAERKRLGRSLEQIRDSAKPASSS